MKNLKLIIVLVLIVGTIVVSSIYNNRQVNALEQKLAFTECKIVDFTHGSRSDFYVEYEFSVNLRIYKGKALTTYFECENGAQGCVGSTFKVGYQKGNPSNNEIDLGIYNKYKKSVNALFKI